MKIYAITPTGDRPEAFKLCQHWMTRQEVIPDKWIIVDDGEQGADPDQFISMKMPTQYFHVKHRGITQGNTLNLNLTTALVNVPFDEDAVVFFWEDDDFYQPDYIRRMMEHFSSGAQAVGEATSVYYNLRERRWIQRKPRPYACLCQTAFHVSLISRFQYILSTTRGGQTADIRFWKDLHETKIPRRLTHYSPPLVIGLKGMPGRKGIGIGHRSAVTMGWKIDPDHKKLKELLGEDYEHYQPIFARLAGNDNAEDSRLSAVQR